MNELSSRQLKILKYLIKIKSTTAENLAVQLNVSSKTIYQDLKTLASLLSEHQINLIKKPGIGIELDGDPQKIKSFLLTLSEKSDVPNNDSQRFVYILTSLVETNHYLTIGNLSEQLFISPRIIEKNIDQIEKYINSFGVELDRKSGKGIKIIADEKQRRKLIFRLLNRFWGEQWSVNHENEIVYHNLTVNSLLDNEIVLKVLRIVEQFVEQTTTPLNDYEFQSLVVHLAIAIQRIQSGKMIDELPIMQGMSQQKLPAAKRLAAMIEKHFCIQLPLAEVKYLQLHLIAADSGGINLKDISKNDTTYAELKWLLKSSGYDGNLLRGLAVHLKSAIKRLQFGVSIANPFTHQIKQNYPAAFDQGLQIAQFYEKKENISLNDDEVAYLALHLQAYLERCHQDDDRLRVIVVCSTGLGSAQLLAAKIRSEFPEVKIQGIYSLSELQEQEPQDADLIISTIEIHSSSIPTVTVSPLFQSNDVNFVTQSLKGIKQNQQRSFDPSQIISSDLIWCHQSFDDWQSGLRWITQQLIRQNVAKSGITEAAFSRENLSFTSFENYATPHASPELIIEPSIAVCTLDPALKWGSQEVSVIFFLAITKNFTPKEVELIFDKLYGILSDKKQLRKLTSFTNSNKLFQYLKGLMKK
jgi:transcriptional antiterminator/mannitol/fructose-specific phosphotransferase system IIA component (Ntr-type)